jgi:hypothetical protein
MGTTQPPTQRVSGLLPSGYPPERAADQSPASTAEVTRGAAILPLPKRLDGMVLN